MTRELCPICQSDAYGCSVREEGAACYAPACATLRPPPSSSSSSRPRPPPTPVHPARGGLVGGIVTFAIPPAAPREPCPLCGDETVWVWLPAGGRLRVDAMTREAHEAICRRRRRT